MKHTAVLIDELCKFGCSVDTAYWGAGEDNEKLYKKITGRISNIKHARRLFDHKDYDVFIIKTAHDWATVTRDLALLLVTKDVRPLTILQIHGSQSHRLALGKPEFFKKATKAILEQCDGVMLLSKEERDDFNRFYGRDKFWIVENPLVPANVDIREIDRWKLPKAEHTLLFAGRLVKEKGVFELLQAMAMITPRHDVHLLMLGVGPEQAAIEHKIRKLGLSCKITLGGYVEGARLASAYKAADVLVLPSWMEGFPTVVTEAMQCGTAIITTPIRGVADHLVDGENVVFTPVKDAPALAKNIENLLDDPHLRRSIVEANNIKVQDFLPEPVAKRYYDAIYDIASRIKKTRFEHQFTARM